MKKFMKTLKIWFERNRSSVIGASLKRRGDDYITLNLKGSVI